MGDEVDRLLEQNQLEPGYVLLIPGASVAHRVKRWPHFDLLAQRLIDTGYKTVTVPGPDEMETCRSMPGTMLVSENGYLDYFGLAGVAKHASYVIGNDTGPTHIAAHLGCEGMALYGGHTPPLTTGIQHTGFNWFEAQDLGEITLETVWRELVDKVGV